MQFCTRVRLFLRTTFILAAAIHGLFAGHNVLLAQDQNHPEYVYVLPSGKVEAQFNNVNAKRVRWSELSVEQQQQFLADQKEKPKTNLQLIDEFKRMSPVLVDDTASRVRVLLACDTKAKNIEQSVAVDRDRMKKFLEEAFKGREQLLDVKTIDGPDLSEKAILNHFNVMNTAATETLVFYYSGHGTSRDGTHFLAMSNGDLLSRNKLLQTMSKRPHRCVIVLTDCCSASAAVDVDQLRSLNAQLFGQDDPLEMPTGIDTRTVNCLLLRHKGTIDITAATVSRDQFSFGNSKYGGFFTYSLIRALRTDVNKINVGRDRKKDVVTWKQAFDPIQLGAAAISLGRTGLPPIDVLISTQKTGRDYVWQWAQAFSFQ